MILLIITTVTVGMSFSTEYVFANSITCNIDQTIQWDEDLQTKVCVANVDDDLTNNEKKNHSDQKPFNLNGFTFNGKEARKNPFWINWVPEEYHVPEIKSVIEQRTENDKISSHGYTRNHYLFNEILIYEENKANSTYPDFKNPDFYRQDNYKSIKYGPFLSRSQNPILQNNMIIQENKAEILLEHLISLRNTRY